MLSYKDLTRHFGTSLFDRNFQTFLTNIFSDLTEYNVLKSDYISSAKAGIELGFINTEAVYDDDENIVFDKGNPVFSHFTLHSHSLTQITLLPFDANFSDYRIGIIQKAGTPIQTKEGYDDFLDKIFLVDNYKLDNTVITFDYDTEQQTINFIQVRDNNLVEHLKL